MTRTLAELHCALAKKRMTAMLRAEVEARERLDQFLVEDILATPDEEILAEFEQRHGDPSVYAAMMRARFEAKRKQQASDDHRKRGDS